MELHYLVAFLWLNHIDQQRLVDGDLLIPLPLINLWNMASTGDS